MPTDGDRIAGMDEEGLRRTLGELLAANRATQADLEKLSQQFPIQPENLSDLIPDWKELEEGGLQPPEEGGEFEEQLGIDEGFADSIWVEVKSDGTILRGGEGLTVEHPKTGTYKIWLQEANDFDYPGALRSSTPSTVGGQAVNVNINLLTSPGGVDGYEIVLVSNVAGSTPIDANFHFFAANLSAE